MKKFYEDDVDAMRTFIRIVNHYNDETDIHVAQSPITLNWIERGWVTVVEVKDHPPSAVMKLTEEGKTLKAFSKL